MSNWDQMETQAFLEGKKLPKEIQETNENHKYLIKTATLLAKIESSINTLKHTVLWKVDQYDIAKSCVSELDLRELNLGMPELKKIMDTNFETTLNGLTVKKENETEEQRNEKISKDFKLPLKK